MLGTSQSADSMSCTYTPTKYDFTVFYSTAGCSGHIYCNDVSTFIADGKRFTGKSIVGLFGSEFDPREIPPWVTLREDLKGIPSISRMFE